MNTNNMDTGELEMRQAFEETTIRNVNAILIHVNETRKQIKELTDKVERQDKTIRGQNEIIDALKLQLSCVQQELYKYGTS